MHTKPTYEELEQKVKQLERDAAVRKRTEQAIQKNTVRFSTNLGMQSILPVERANSLMPTLPY